MLRLSASVAAMTLIFALAPGGTAQPDTDRAATGRDSLVTDPALGIAYLQIGPSARHGQHELALSLQSPVGSIRGAVLTVCRSQKPFVDLSGSFGGRMDTDDPKITSLLENRVRVDTVELAGLRFRREFWAVYAGMGEWEGVITCYAPHDGVYYVLSLHTGVNLGKPGEVVDGTPIGAEPLRRQLANMLFDDREPLVRRFNDFLSTIQLTN